MRKIEKNARKNELNWAKMDKNGPKQGQKGLSSAKGFGAA